MSGLFVPSSQSGPSRSKSVLFAASTTHVAHLAEILHSLSTIDRYALLTITAEGITFFAEQNHIINTLANIDATLFSTYEFYGSDVASTQFGIDITLLSELLAAAASVPTSKMKAGSGTAGQLSDSAICYFKYEGEGFPLIVEFEDRLIIELLEFSTFDLNLDNPYSAQDEFGNTTASDGGLIVDSTRLQFEVIIKSDILSILLQDLNALDTDELYVFVSNKNGNHLLNFVSKCALGHTKLIFPNDKMSLQKLEVYSDQMEPTEDNPVLVLHFKLFVRVLRAVKLSTKCKMVRDCDGVVSLQLICKNVNCVGYPGTMITFNMLEKATTASETSTTDIVHLFDEGACDYIKEFNLSLKESPNAYLTSNDTPATTGSLTALSYALFKAPSNENQLHAPSNGDPQLFF